MTTKIKLLEKINLIENDIYLKALLEYLEESEKNSITLSEQDKIDIEKSNQQLKNGEYLSQSELINKAKEWIDE